MAERMHVLQHTEQQTRRTYEGPSVWDAMPARDVEIRPAQAFVVTLDLAKRKLLHAPTQRSAARHEPHEVTPEVRAMHTLNAVRHLLGEGWRNLDVARALGVERVYVNGVKQAVTRRQQRLARTGVDS